MPVKKLIPTSEVVEALRTVPTIDFAGEPHVDPDEVLRVVQYLVRGGDINDQLDVGNPAANPLAGMERREGRAGLWPPEPTVSGPAIVIDERPPGPCVGCGHSAHPSTVCDHPVYADPETGEPCGCDDYVDSTVRGVQTVDPATGEEYPCTCGHGPHLGQCTGWRAGHEANGQCLCMVYDPDRGPGPGGEIPPVMGPAPDVNFQDGRLMRNAPPVE